MIGIIILNYNSWEDSKGCIESIYENKPQSSFRIYLVDNASPIAPSEDILNYFKKQEIVYISGKENKGYAAGNNIGIAEAVRDDCDAVLISNSDVRFYRNSVDILYEYLQSHPDIGIVGPKIHLPDGTIQKECMAIQTRLKEKYLLRTRLKFFFPQYNSRYWGRDHDYEKEIFQVYAVLGCCFMVNRACVDDVMPLDEHTFLYEEELILGIKMEKKGWKTVYNPQSEILHKHEMATGGIGRNPFAYTCQICSEIYYCMNYLGANVWEIIPLYCYRTLLYLGRCLRNRRFREYWGKYIRLSIREFRKGVNDKEKY